VKKLLTALLLISASVTAQKGYRITASFKPYTKGYLYLGHYFGAKKLVVDSALINAKGQAVFTGKEKITGGIYFIVNPEKSRFYEVLMDDKQNFTASADTADLVNSVKITGSKENEIFLQYQKTSAQKYKQLQKLNGQLAAARTKNDSALIKTKLEQVNKSNHDLRLNIIKTNPNTLIASLFNTLKEPVLPPKLKEPKNAKDSLEAYRYYKKHYWDDVSFTDERILRTPFFEGKLEKYMQQVINQHPDSVKEEVDWIVLYSRASKNMFKYFVSKFTSDYFYPKYMGQDAVFLLLFQKYYLTGQVDWFNEQQMKDINNRGYSIMTNQLGEKAADLKLLDSTDKVQPLYAVNAAFTVVLFWDPDCGHCREEMPKLDSIFKNKWRKINVALYAVFMDTLRVDNKTSWDKLDVLKNNWKKFISEHQLTDWIHVYQTPQMKLADYEAKIPGPRQLYDVYQTPTLYLLDKDKRIIAKKLDLLQIDELIQFKLKNPTN
jgi:thiol-disulfide isomerase/thioredoxin